MSKNGGIPQKGVATRFCAGEKEMAQFLAYALGQLKGATWQVLDYGIGSKAGALVGLNGVPEQARIFLVIVEGMQWVSPEAARPAESDVLNRLG